MSMPFSAHEGTLSANNQMGGRPCIELRLMLNTCKNRSHCNAV